MITESRTTVLKEVNSSTNEEAHLTELKLKPTYNSTRGHKLHQNHYFRIWLSGKASIWWCLTLETHALAMSEKRNKQIRKDSLALATSTEYNLTYGQDPTSPTDIPVDEFKNQSYLRIACEQQTHFRSSLGSLRKIAIFRRDRSDDWKCVCCSQANLSHCVMNSHLDSCTKFPQPEHRLSVFPRLRFAVAFSFPFFFHLGRKFYVHEVRGLWFRDICILELKSTCWL